MKVGFDFLTNHLEALRRGILDDSDEVIRLDVQLVLQRRGLVRWHVHEFFFHAEIVIVENLVPKGSDG